MFPDQQQPLPSTQQKNMMKKTQMCNVENRIEETRTLLKAKIVIKENVKISKYQNINEGNSSSIKWGRWTCVVLLTGSKNSWIFQLLSFIVGSRYFVDQELISWKGMYL